MTNTVELSVRSQLLQVVDELNRIAETAEKTSDGLNGFATSVGENIEHQTRKTETFLGKIRGIGGKVAKGMSDDFKALFNMTRLAEGLKLGNIFRQSIVETMELSNQIRKLSEIFGIAEDRFVTFQTRITDGLGEIGLSSEAATNSLKGLAETQVRGEENLLAYSKAAGMLSSLSQTQGREGEIAKGISNVIVQKGGNPSDIGQVNQIAQTLKQAYIAMGKTPTEVLSSLGTLLEAMPQDLRKALDIKSLLGTTVAGAVAGPNATKFLIEYLSKGPIARKPLEARGFDKVFTKEGGFNIKEFRSASKNVMNQFQGDPRLMAQTLGLSEEAAEGFVRLTESLDKIDTAQTKMLNDNKSLEQSYYAAMTAGEAFRANINKFKASFSEPIALMTNYSADALKAAFQTSLDDIINILPESIKGWIQYEKKGVEPYLPQALDKNIGSTGVVAAGGILTTLLAGGGAKGLMNLGAGKVKGVAERVAYEQLTGEKVQSVYVVNAAEISGGANAVTSNAASGMLKNFVLLGGSAVAGAAVGTVINEAIKDTAIGKALDDFAGYLGGATQKLKEFVTGPSYTLTQPVKQNNMRQDVNVKVNIETKNKDLKATIQPTRGSSQ